MVNFTFIYLIYNWLDNFFSKKDLNGYQIWISIKYYAQGKDFHNKTVITEPDSKGFLWTCWNHSDSSEHVFHKLYVQLKVVVVVSRSVKAVYLINFWNLARLR